MNIEAKIREISKKMTNIITTIETGLDPVDLKGRYNELKSLRDELEHELDEEKCHNPIMIIDDIKLTLSRCRTISLNSLKEKKILIDLMINSVILNGDRSIDIVFNYREREPHVSIPFRSSTKTLAWSTILKA